MAKSLIFKPRFKFGKYEEYLNKLCVNLDCDITLRCSNRVYIGNKDLIAKITPKSIECVIYDNYEAYYNDTLLKMIK